ncbi:MAG: pyruvate, phosphate dikinase [Piscirickettsiaceae bacterium]|nr:pyruvate, phosphate dikinase [Piscirickettsiaceae bacterium]
MNTHKFHFGTKSETLALLKDKLSLGKLLPQYVFTCDQWNRKSDNILHHITSHFSDEFLAIRSSAQGEDGQANSMAGAYDSVLNVKTDNFLDIKNSILKVMSSFSGNPLDQVLVQPMLQDIALSGVAMTHDIETGAPYYVISYDDETGRTDTVTSGQEVNKTVLVYREYDRSLIESDRIRTILKGLHELEEICGNEPLDVEFVLTPLNELYILQVRRIALHHTWHPVTERRTSRKLTFIEQFINQRSLPKKSLLGQRTILGVMSDWNPAEIIGVTSRPLAVSLYRHLITHSIWRDARAMMGYRNVPAEELMVVIDHHPYIDIRNSFNSFLPENLSNEIGSLLVDAWLERLNQNPELHDKVEFEIAHTCMDVDFERSFAERYPNLLDSQQLFDYQSELRLLTNHLMDISEKGNLQTSMARVNQLVIQQQSRHKDNIQNSSDPLQTAIELLNECQQFGTLPFACLARHGFIVEAILRSLITRDALTTKRVEQLKQAVQTVTSNLVTDFQQAGQDEDLVADFINKYGHLRPGTYDITSMRYDECPDLFSSPSITYTKQSSKSFIFTEQELELVSQLFDENGLTIAPEIFLQYAEMAIKGRELGKFVFTKNLSDALFSLEVWGEKNGLSREDVSYLDWQDISASQLSPLLDYQDRHFLNLASEAEKNLRAAQPLRLGHLLRDARDVFVVPLNRNDPNFVTTEIVEGQPVILDEKSSVSQPLFNKIVCIKNADPGFDWIFTKGILGLITQFGGVNSHMAIRCAEFGIPAAIGCGEQTFRRMTTTDHIVLNCHSKVLKAIRHE